MIEVVLSLGTNLGDRGRNMREMLLRVQALLAPPLEMSTLMETEPLGMPGCETWFLNRAVKGAYGKTAQDLLAQCLAIERELGRVRDGTVLPRSADIDILLYGNGVIANTNLTVPHPRMLQRRFCLEALRQLVPNMLHPVVGRSFETLAGEMSAEVRAQRMRVLSGEARGARG